jgi:hypothetical protein
MTFFILIGHVATVFLTMNFLTTLSFEREVTSFMYGGNGKDVFISLGNKGKTLVIKPKVKNIDSNLLVITKDQKFYFHIKYGGKSEHQFVEIKRGEINTRYRKIVGSTEFELLEGKSSVLFINKGKRARVNGREVMRKSYLSKGIPIFMNEKRIY